MEAIYGSMAAFALSRYAFRGRDGLFLLFTAGLLFPLNTAALPLFLMLQKIGMNDNLLGVALPEAAFSLPVTIVILRPFMRAIPGELEDAATVDGATRIRFFLRILLPLSRPALITVGMLAFVTSWNTYLLPLIVLSTPSHFTLPLAVAMFQSQYSTDTARVFAHTALLVHSFRKLDPRVERVLFALVANRALAASSKLAAAGWIGGDAHIDGLDEIDEQSCYRAMDYLLTIEPDLAKEAYFQVTDLLNLEVDLLFFDTTSTYFETGEADEPVPRDKDGNCAGEGDDAAVKDTGFRTHGKSKDSRDDLPQVVVGMAVTRDGIPVRVWSWPGSTTDTDLIRQVRRDIREWTLSRVVWVADRGFTSQKNRRALMQGGGGYIIGEKLRSGSAEVKAALSRQGRYATVRDNMQVKEVSIDSDDRFVLCFNPAQAGRDAAIRAKLVAQLEDAITGTDTLTAAERARIEGTLSGKPGLKRFLRTTPSGLLRIDKQKIRIEANLDGKYLLRCSDPHLSAEDIALGYKRTLHAPSPVHFRLRAALPRRWPSQCDQGLSARARRAPGYLPGYPGARRPEWLRPSHLGTRARLPLLQACPARHPVRGAEGGEPEILLEFGVGRLGVEVHVVDRGVPLAGEKAGHPGVRVPESPDGERYALAHRETRLQHLPELIRLRERGQVVGGHLVGRVVHERADIGLGDGHLQAKAGVPLQVLGHLRAAEPVLRIEVPLVPDSVDRYALGEHLLEPREHRVALGVRAVLAGDVVVVVEEQRVRICLVRPAEGVRDDACPEVRDPEVIRVDRRGIAVGEELVGHVPLPDPAFVARYLGNDVLVQQVFELGVSTRCGQCVVKPGSAAVMAGLFS